MPRPHGAPGVDDGTLEVYHVRQADPGDDPAEVQRQNVERLGLCPVCGCNARGLENVVVTPIAVPCGPNSGDAWELVQKDVGALADGALIWETGRVGVELPDGLQSLLEEMDGRRVDDRLATLQGHELAELFASVRDEVEEAMDTLKDAEGDRSAGPDYDLIRQRLKEADVDAQRLFLREVLRAHCVNGTINGASHALLLATRSNNDIQIIRDPGQGKNAGEWGGRAADRARRAGERGADAPHSVLHRQVRQQGDGGPDVDNELHGRRVEANHAVPLRRRGHRQRRPEAPALPPGTSERRDLPGTRGGTARGLTSHQRLANGEIKAAELRDTQLAAVALGYPSELLTTNFTYASVWLKLAEIQEVQRRAGPAIPEGEAEGSLDAARTVDGGDRREGGPSRADEGGSRGNDDGAEGTGGAEAQDPVAALADVFQLLDKTQREVTRSSVSGAAKVYTIREANGNLKSMAIPFTDHYRHRGNCPEMRAMSLNEYLSCVQVVEATAEVLEQFKKQQLRRQQNGQRGRGRPALWLRKFDAEHPLHETYLQRGRAKLAIPLFGRGLPTIPRSFFETLSSWAAEGDEAAAAEVDRAVAFFSMLLVPWDAETGVPPEETLTLDGLLAYFKPAEATPAERKILRSRWVDFYRMSAPFFPAPEGPQKAMQAGRDRARDGWLQNRGPTVRSHVRTGLQGSEMAPWPANGADLVDESGDGDYGCEEAELALGDEELDLQILKATDSAFQTRLATLRKREQFYKHTVSTTVRNTAPSMAATAARPIPSLHLGAGSVAKKFAALEKLEGIEGGAIQRAAAAAGTNVEDLTKYAEFLLATPGVQDPFTDATRPSFLPKPLSDHQNERTKEILQFFRSDRSGSLAVLLHGPAGTGKTHVYRVLDAALQLLNLGESRAMALTGVACTQLGGTAATLHWHRLLQITGMRRSGKGGRHDASNFANAIDARLAAGIRARLGLRPALLYIDEVSMLSAQELWTIDSRLRAAYDKEKIFGGIPIIFAGDFLQIPCLGTRLLRAACTPHVLPEAGSGRAAEALLVAHAGGRLLGELKRIDLTEQQRVRCEQARKRLEDQRDPAKATPFPRQLWQQELRILTEHRLHHDPEFEKFRSHNTLVGVLNNAERCLVNVRRAEAQARDEGKLLYRWPVRFDGQGKLNAHQLSMLRDENETLYEYALEDAPVMLTANISVPLDLANGSVGRLEGLVFAEEGSETNTTHAEAASAAAACTGANRWVVTLDKPPLALAVSIPGDALTYAPDDVKVYVGGTPCVLLCQQKKFKRKLPLIGGDIAAQINGYDLKGTHAFPFQLGYACTINKLQVCAHPEGVLTSRTDRSGTARAAPSTTASV